MRYDAKDFFNNLITKNKLSSVNVYANNDNNLELEINNLFKEIGEATTSINNYIDTKSSYYILLLNILLNEELNNAKIFYIDNIIDNSDIIIL